jgi:small-conductance mechanosensitive channel
MESIQEFLNITLITIAGYNVTLAEVLYVPTLLIVGYVLVRWLVMTVTKTLSRKGVSPDAVQIVRRALFILGFVVLFITTLDLLNVPLTAFGFVSGAVAIGVGFGAQNIINNFISGWILMWERPIRINDFIEVGDTSGTVEEINTRSTRVRRVDGVHLLVPNSQLLEQTVVNWTLIDRMLRCVVRVGVAYGSDVKLVQQLLLKAMKEDPMIQQDPEPQAIFEDFGDNSLNFDCMFWVETTGDKNARVIRSDLRFAIDAAFAEHGIVIAFPQRDVHLDGSISIRTNDA